MGAKVVTISRQYGAGGRDVGRRVAERLGIAFYDKELLVKIAEKSGLAPSYISEAGEYATSKSEFLFNLNALQAPSYVGLSLPNQTMPIPDQLYVIQNNIVAELADREPCVIVGRCADYTLRERGDCLHVFLHADAAHRAERILRVYGDDVADPMGKLKDMDAKRGVYYSHYTGRTWGMAHNYHLSLDSGKFGVDRCVDAVVDLAKG